jgi:hypothetical protein
MPVARDLSVHNAPNKRWGRLGDAPEVIEKILRHLDYWPEHGPPACLSRASPSTPPPDGVERISEPFFDDLPAVSATQSLQAGPFPDYDTEPVMAYAHDPDFAA